MTDTERLDWLESYLLDGGEFDVAVHPRGGIVVFLTREGQAAAGVLKASLREAIDSAMETGR